MKEPPLLENKMHCHCFPLSGSAVHVCKFRMHLTQLDLCILCHMSDTFCGQHYLDCLPPYTKHILNWRFCYKPLRILCKFYLTCKFIWITRFLRGEELRTHLGCLGPRCRICSAEEQWLAAAARELKMQLTAVLVFVLAAVVTSGMTEVVFPEEEAEAGECLPLYRCCHLARIWRERHQRQVGIWAQYRSFVTSIVLQWNK